MLSWKSASDFWAWPASWKLAVALASTRASLGNGLSSSSGPVCAETLAGRSAATAINATRTRPARIAGEGIRYFIGRSHRQESRPSLQADACNWVIGRGTDCDRQVAGSAPSQGRSFTVAAPLDAAADPGC